MVRVPERLSFLQYGLLRALLPQRTMDLQTRMAEGDRAPGLANPTGGSTTLPRVPPPVNHQPTGTNNRTAQCLECGRLFRLGLATQVVSPPSNSFHAAQREDGNSAI